MNTMALLRFRTVPYRLCGRISSRSFANKQANESTGQSYIEEWQASTMKPAEFYESNSAPGVKRKNYFYNIDLQGRVFLEDTMPKNIATSIKNVEFLSFFFQRLRRVGPKQREILRELDAEDDYPFVSPCGLELNFVRGADLPIVFTGIQSSRDESSTEKELAFGGSLAQPFQPGKLAISSTTGRLYHELLSTTDNNLTPLHASEDVEYGLIRSSVAVSLSESIVAGTDENVDTWSGMEFHDPSSNCSFPIKWLPQEAHPGPSAMPFVEGIE